MELMTTTVTEGWRVVRRRFQAVTQQTRHFDTEEAALAWIETNKISFPRDSLGVQWQHITVDSGTVEWIHEKGDRVSEVLS